MKRQAVLEAVRRFLPAAMQDNPFVTALLAGATAIAIIVATPAFAPIGVVGSLGWMVVYFVTFGTLGIEGARHIYRPENQ